MATLKKKLFRLMISLVFYAACDKNKTLYLFDDIPHKNPKNTSYQFSGKTEYTRVFKKIGCMKNIDFDNSPKKLIMI